MGCRRGRAERGSFACRDDGHEPPTRKTMRRIYHGSRCGSNGKVNLLRKPAALGDRFHFTEDIQTRCLVSG